MRKKKRQSEREAEIAHRNNHYIWGNTTTKDEAEVDSSIRHHDPSENKGIFANDFQLRVQNKNLDEIGKGQLDLNSDPERGGQFHQEGSTRVSMMSLLQVACQPLENYLKQNGLTSLVAEQQGSSGSQSLPQGTTERVRDGFMRTIIVSLLLFKKRTGTMSWIKAKMIFLNLLPCFVCFFCFFVSFLYSNLDEFVRVDGIRVHTIVEEGKFIRLIQFV